MCSIWTFGGCSGSKHFIVTYPKQIHRGINNNVNGFVNGIYIRTLVTISLEIIYPIVSTMVSMIDVDIMIEIDQYPKNARTFRIHFQQRLTFGAILYQYTQSIWFKLRKSHWKCFKMLSIFAHHFPERRPLKSSAQIPLFRSPSARLVQHDKLLADDAFSRGSDGSIVCSLGGLNNKEVHHYTFQPSKQIVSNLFELHSRLVFDYYHRQ